MIETNKQRKKQKRTEESKKIKSESKAEDLWLALGLIRTQLIRFIANS